MHLSPEVISFVNQKGGCGKSSLCFHLSGALSELGLSVLLIDADPQGSLGRAFLGAEAIDRLIGDETLAAVFEAGMVQAQCTQLVRPVGFERLQLIPANQRLARWNQPSPEHSGMTQFLFQTLVEDATSEIDVVMIDCPPNLYQCTWNALIASDFVVVPVPPEDFGTQGLPAVHQAIDQARRLNANLELLGHAITRVDRRLLVHAAYERSLREIYGPTVLETVIPEASAFKVALASRCPVTLHAPRSRATTQTRALAGEILTRIERLRRPISLASN